MGIRLDPQAFDQQGLPIVSWQEGRNLFAPDGLGLARVTCFIRPNKAGVLQFVSRGSVRHGAVDEERPWEALVSFSIETADQHYHSAADRAVFDVLGSRGKGAGRLLTTDGAYVLLANFADDRPSLPMHLNCADCTPAEARLLHDRLFREFIGKRGEVLHNRNDDSYTWTARDDFHVYTPLLTAGPARWQLWLINAFIAAVVGLIGLGFYWAIARW